MKRRDFLKSVSGLAAAPCAGAAIWSALQGGSRSETLLIVSEGGPNNLDIHGVGTNVPVMKCRGLLRPPDRSRDESGPGGVPYYDRDKFKPELAGRHECRRHVGHLQTEEDAKFHDGAPVTARDVKWSLDRPSASADSRLQMSAGLADKTRAVRHRRRQHGAGGFRQKDRLTIPDLAGDRALPWSIRTGEEERFEKTPGASIYQTADRRLRRLQSDEMDRRHRIYHGTQRRLGRRTVAEDQARDLAHGAAGRQPPRRCSSAVTPTSPMNCRTRFSGAQIGRQARHRVAAFSNGIPVHRHERDQTAVRQSEGAPGGGLRDPLSEDHGSGAVWVANPMFGAAPTKNTTSPGRSRPSFLPTSTRPRRCLRGRLSERLSRHAFIRPQLAGVNEPLCVLVQESLGQIGIKTTINKVPAPTGAPN